MKVTGGVKFTAASLPTGNLPVWIRVMAVKATDVQAITGEDVATDVIEGAVNVDEALAVLKKKNFVSGATKIADLGTNYESDYTINEDGYYFIVASNTGTSTWVWSYIKVNGIHCSTAFAPSGDWFDIASSPIPIKAGTVVRIRSRCGYASGLYKMNFTN